MRRAPRRSRDFEVPEIRELREEWEALGLTAAEVAEAVGVTAETLSRWLRGRLRYRPDTPDRIRAALPGAVAARQRQLREEARRLGQGGRE